MQYNHISNIKSVYSVEQDMVEEQMNQLRRIIDQERKQNTQLKDIINRINTCKQCVRLKNITLNTINTSIIIDIQNNDIRQKIYNKDQIQFIKQKSKLYENKNILLEQQIVLLKKQIKIQKEQSQSQKQQYNQFYIKRQEHNLIINKMQQEIHILKLNIQSLQNRQENQQINQKTILKLKNIFQFQKQSHAQQIASMESQLQTIKAKAIRKDNQHSQELEQVNRKWWVVNSELLKKVSKYEQHFQKQQAIYKDLLQESEQLKYQLDKVNNQKKILQQDLQLCSQMLEQAKCGYTSQKTINVGMHEDSLDFTKRKFQLANATPDILKGSTLRSVTPELRKKTSDLQRGTIQLYRDKQLKQEYGDCGLQLKKRANTTKIKIQPKKAPRYRKASFKQSQHSYKQMSFVRHRRSSAKDLSIISNSVGVSPQHSIGKENRNPNISSFAQPTL